MSTEDKLWAIIAVILVVIVFTVLGMGYIECQELGGDYVRGLVSMECINKELS